MFIVIHETGVYVLVVSNVRQDQDCIGSRLYIVMAKDLPLWYHAGITGDEATKILTKFRSPGAFLLRDSQNTEGAFTLTVSWYVLLENRFKSYI